MDKPKNILFFYDYFYPGYKAGGPIQSLTNLALALEDEYTISVITSAYDLNTTEPFEKITTNTWNKVTIPGSKHAINVYYADKAIDKSVYGDIIKSADPSVVYFNNIYSTRFFRQALKILEGLEKKPKVVICPRGMLQKGALAVKPLKKKIYLYYLRRKGLLNNVVWHGTSNEEAEDIKKYFPKNRAIVVAPNIPKVPYSHISLANKEPGKLRLVYLSLIAEKKNLLLVLKMVGVSANVTLDIYGPIADKTYWMQCELVMENMPGKVNYKGDIKPADVQKVLSQYDAMILLTQGENFGHALYESLSVGRPVITSYFTPWINLEEQKAGWNVDINSVSICIGFLTHLTKMSPDAFNEYCVGAHKMAVNYYAGLKSVEDYKKLFS